MDEKTRGRTEHVRPDDLRVQLQQHVREACPRLARGGKVLGAPPARVLAELAVGALRVAEHLQKPVRGGALGLPEHAGLVAHANLGSGVVREERVERGGTCAEHGEARSGERA